MATTKTTSRNAAAKKTTAKAKTTPKATTAKANGKIAEARKAREAAMKSLVAAVAKLPEGQKFNGAGDLVRTAQPSLSREASIRLQEQAQTVLRNGAKGVGVGGRYRDLTPKAFLAAYAAREL